MKRSLSRRVAVALSATALLAASAVGVSAQTDFETGSGKAEARVIRIGPSSAQLGLTPTLALALADYIGTQGRGEARALDYAALQKTVDDFERDSAGRKVLTEDTYPNLRVTSADPPEQRAQRVANPPFVQQVRAATDPFGEATATIDGFELGGLIKVSQGRAWSYAGLVEVDGTPLRVAGGTVDIGRVEFGGGLVVLNGLHWEVEQRTGADTSKPPQQTGSFVVGDAVVQGTGHRGPLTGAQLAQVFSSANTILAPTGIRLDAPGLENLNGAARVSPLGIRIVDSELGNTVVAPILDAAQPVREPITGGLIEGCEDCASLVLVADVLVGVASGAGRFDIELGGAAGFTEGSTFDNPFAAGLGFAPTDGGLGSGAPAAGGTGFDGGTDPTVLSGLGSDSDAGIPAAPTTTNALDGDPAREGVERAGAAGGAASNAAWALGLLGIIGSGAMAATDYRRLRARRLGIPA